MLDKTDQKDQYIQMFLYLIFHNSLFFSQLPAPQYLIFLANRWLLQHALQSVRLWLSLICLIILINYFCKCQKSSAHILLFKKYFEDHSSKYATLKYLQYFYRNCKAQLLVLFITSKLFNFLSLLSLSKFTWISMNLFPIL